MDRQARVKPLPRVVRRGIDAARRLFPSLPVPYPLPWGGWLLLGPDGTGLGLLNGTYEEQKELDWIQRVLKPGMVFFDIGANQGIYTVVAAKAVGETGRVYAFEPVPSELRKLRANLRFNRLRNVTVVDKAVGDYDGTTTIHACEPHKGGFSSIKAPSDYLNLKWEIIEVPIMRLDTFVQQQGIERIDYLKMDVEGAERIVIAGGRDVLAHYRPLVQAELADGRTEAWGYHSREIALDLERHGYVMCEAEGLGIRRHNIQEGYQYTDLIGVPEERLSELKEAMTTS